MIEFTSPYCCLSHCPEIGLHLMFSLWSSDENDRRKAKTNDYQLLIFKVTVALFVCVCVCVCFVVGEQALLVHKLHRRACSFTFQYYVVPTSLFPKNKTA